MKQENQTSRDTGLIAAAASLTEKPFKTAFMATLGVGVAQLFMVFMFFASLAIFLLIAGFLFRSM